MWFAIIAKDRSNSLELRLKLREEHRKRLTLLQQQGRLLLAGPFPALESDAPGEAGWRGSLIVAEFDSLAEAQNWAAADPYHLNPVYQQVEVLPFTKVFPASLQSSDG